MSPRERAFVLWAIKYMMVYIPAAFIYALICFALKTESEWVFFAILPFHFLGMIQSFVALGLTLNDLYWRPFPSVWWKWGWLFLIAYTGGIGWLVYIFKYALKPRPLPSDFHHENVQAVTAS